MSAGFNASAFARPTTHAQVLLAIVAKLQNSIEPFTSDSVCFVSDSPWPSVEIQDNLFCTVSPADGQFDDAGMDGAANVGVVEETFSQVTVYSRIEVDQIEHFQQGLVDAERGLLTLKQQVLQALAGKNLDGGTFQGNDSLLLHEGMRPARSSHKPRDTNHSDDFASFSLAFRMKFTWDLGPNLSQF